MKEEQVQFNFNARYYKSGAIIAPEPQVWFVLHGYGQLAYYFIRKFDALTSHPICVIAPEGLSRFYLDPLSGTQRASQKVGATWMTRENREADIANYIHYLQSVYDKELGAFPDARVTVLGFSQGAATASRWLLSGLPRFDRFILWSGIFPPDMEFEKGKSLFKDKEIISVFGNDDPFLTEDKRHEMKSLSLALGVSPREITFDGGHEIDKGTLLTLSKTI